MQLAFKVAVALFCHLKWPPPHPPPPATQEIVNHCCQRTSTTMTWSPCRSGHLSIANQHSEAALIRTGLERRLLLLGSLLHLLGAPLAFPVIYPTQPASRITSLLNLGNYCRWRTTRIEDAIDSPSYGPTRQTGSYYFAYRRSPPLAHYFKVPRDVRVEISSLC